MHRRLGFLALVTLLAVPASAGAVSGGAVLPIAQAPYVAWLDGHCTGTLISPTRILTAGHCLDNHSASEQLLLVGVDGNTLSPKQRNAMAIPIAGYSVHPKFKESFPFAHDDPFDAIAVNDVGLILLKKPLTTVTPVRLAGPGDAALEAPGAQSTLIGYGQTAPETQTSVPPTLPLQQGALPIISASDCGLAYPHAIQPSMGCNEDLAHHTPLIQACPGDSGGPVIVSTPSGPVQIGVTSWGSETMNGACGEKFLPNVYMRTAAFTDFINQKDPVIEPFLKAKRSAAGLGSPSAKVVGTRRVGRTIKCVAPKLGGDRYKLSYAWVDSRTEGFVAIPGKTKQTLKITPAVYRHLLPQSRRVGCKATARNAGGSLELFSGTLPVHK